jgi:superfamily II DNA helicase RecQ
MNAASQIISECVRQTSRNAGSGSRACCMKIQKTVIYIDSIAAIEVAVRVLVIALMRAGCSKTAASNAVQPYHSELANFDKEFISKEFAKPDVESVQESSRLRIVLATDAMGMGIDNPDIRCVVQWKQPPSLCALWQRAGRAARSPAVNGEFLWLVEPWCFKHSTDTPSNSHAASQSLLQGSKTQVDVQRRSSLPRGMCELINRVSCIRRGILKFFGDDISLCSRPICPQSCCSLCRGENNSVPQSKTLKCQVQSLQSQKHVVEEVRTALLKWRRDLAQQVYVNVATTEREELVLPMLAIRRISQTASTIESVETLGVVSNDCWPPWEQHAAEIFCLIQKACASATTALELKYRPRKRRALTAVDANVQRFDISQQSGYKVMRLI